MARPTQSWKGFERRLAKRFGTIREGATGDSGADFYTSSFSVQCKLRKDVPKWLIDGMKNAVMNATEGRVPLLLIKKNGRSMLDDETLVVMPLSEFESMMGEG